MMEFLDPTQRGRYARELESKPRQLVVGQDDALREIVNVWQTHMAGPSPADRPIGSFLFLGQPGPAKRGWWKRPRSVC